MRADYNFLRRSPDEDEREITREEVERDYPEMLSEVDDVLNGKIRETDILLIADLLLAPLQSGVSRSSVIHVALSANAPAIELAFT